MIHVENFGDLLSLDIGAFAPKPTSIEGDQEEATAVLWTSPDGKMETGIWECTPGKFERVLPNAEVMHILTGACIFTPTGGEPLHIQAGDTLFFPAHTTGVWHITETLRKVFFIVAQ